LEEPDLRRPGDNVCGAPSDHNNDPAYSPDGSKLAVERGQPDSEDPYQSGNEDIFVMATPGYHDGSGAPEKTNLTEHPTLESYDPDWQPLCPCPAPPDFTPPIPAPPTPGLVAGSTMGTLSVPVKLTWSATDAGSGVARYELEHGVNGGAYVDVSEPSDPATALTAFLEPGKTHLYRVRAKDWEDNWSGWAQGPAFIVDRREENYQTVTYTGTWPLQSLSTASGGYLKYASASGARSRFAFSGRGVAWIAPKGPNRGKAEVWVDGAKAATIDLYSPTSTARQMVYTKSWSSSASHTLEVRVLGTKNASSTGKRVDVDAFVALR
jgi:hypothetical protein